MSEGTRALALWGLMDTVRDALRVLAERSEAQVLLFVPVGGTAAEDLERLVVDTFPGEIANVGTARDDQEWCVIIHMHGWKRPRKDVLRRWLEVLDGRT